ncbi:hypothetical protein MX659_05285 [Coriobacteriia bacterium Es71-Z0120]|uniref:hypothetical protein n=1 Tax=Parvivirga hydrogeniphila TaxID=2939460 RepID=UPI00226096D1|nr:hypothetical protein [Parvivirga hydrogeniphila]MCL4079005.1 hypothetical protein [Parvivirga hydrogeniphila]
MARSTRLYQRARSPLIQGRSRRERPWRSDFALAAAWGIAVLFALMMGSHYAETGALVPADALASAWGASAAAGAVLALGSAAVGVTLARAWGADRPARTGAVVSCGTVVVYWLLFGGMAAARR